MTLPKAYLSRRISFSACHRLNSLKLSPEENVQIYGKLNINERHGHNYRQVTLFGPVDPITGMVENLSILKQYMEQGIMQRNGSKIWIKMYNFGHERPSTTENVALYIWSRIRSMMARPELLHEVKIHETENNVVIYRGE
ncbi:pyruvoyl tetrahydrobiopterin synthase [Holotrichia oblita]|uniref:Pyruvoyl tetrahydrobiopterin synthase n=1 Tax=Holotrichia oblita TaxID=644536 RepID=A0ACB9T4Q3_HOLOL|nr:pyruvoyl tetrahydrobiopterin synthase [Holotrichia oblita]